MAEQPSVEIRGVSHGFLDNLGLTRQALIDIDLDFPTGTFTSIVGPSGCGKTTLLNLLVGLFAPDQGVVKIGGLRPRLGDRSVGYAFARDALLPWRTAVRNVELSLEPLGVGRAERRARALEALAELGLEDSADVYPAQLSQGMRQRVAIARTLVSEPSLLLMDEPFSALDAQTRIHVQDAFVRMWERRNMTVLLITHDLSEGIALSDRVVVMRRQPGSIKAQYEVALPRPRRINKLQGDQEFHKLYGAIWRELEDEFSGD